MVFKDNKSVMALLGLIGVIAILIFYYYINIFFWKLVMWPWSVSELLSEYKEPLRVNKSLRLIATGLLISIAFILFKLKKKAGIIVAAIEIVGGMATIYYSFLAKFDNDILYILALAGGVFLMSNGFELYQIKYKEDEDKKAEPKRVTSAKS